MRKRYVVALVALLVVTVLAPAGVADAAPRTSRSAFCGPSAAVGPPPAGTRARRLWLDRCVRLNEVQSIGSHNSYHVQASPALFALLTAFDPGLAASIEYTHRPLEEQLDLGIRQFELDVFADPAGGLYADPVGQQLAPGPDPDPADVMDEPGFTVLHVQDVDFRSTCLTFVACLQTVKAWSDAHPGHLPIMILVETKDDPIPDPGLGFVVPLPIGPAELDALDAEIRSVFGPGDLLAPDDIRRTRPTLRDAVVTDGWPVLGAVRGRVMFALDNTGSERTSYLAGHPTLEGRAMFVSAAPPSPAAAFVKLNDPVGDSAQIRSLVAGGFVVRTRADADTVQARTGDTTMRDAALASGAQWVSTDYYEPSPFGTGYVVRTPHGRTFRCNPVLTWGGCRTDLLE